MTAGSSTKGLASHNLFLRIISGLVLAALALGLAYLGGPLFVLFWTAVAFAVWWEWVRLVQRGSSPALLAAGFCALAIAVVLLMADMATFSFMTLAIGLVVVALVSGRNAAWAAFGLLYASILALAPALLRDDDEVGRTAVFFLFAVVWATDILAYFVGRAMGGPKLAASVSPNKTWSGAIGGTFGAVAAGLMVVSISGIAVTPGIGLAALMLSIVSQAGDLFESRLKRLFDVKDSSALIPGHGGVMDRVDGFVAAAAAAVLIGGMQGDWNAPAHGLLGW